MNKIFVIALLLALWGCAPAREFQSLPQEGASRSDAFPRFSDRPEAETTQFTIQESQNLAAELEQEVQRLKKVTGARSYSGKNTADRQKQMRAQVDETLRKIEQGAATPSETEEPNSAEQKQ